jgi:Calcineurin-like phosphoesterase
MLVPAGNHEQEPSLEGYYYQAWNARFTPAMPQTAISGSPYWWSVDLGLAHIITLSPFHDYNATSPQYQWLKADLEAVNKTVTPWIFGLWHMPMYHSYDDAWKLVGRSPPLGTSDAAATSYAALTQPAVALLSAWHASVACFCELCCFTKPLRPVKSLHIPTTFTLAVHVFFPLAWRFPVWCSLGA